MSDVVINKCQSIQRCVVRARQEYAAAEDFAGDYTRQDAAILNVTRACEQAIDLANHAIRVGKLGVPKDSGESFDLLEVAGIIDSASRSALKMMVGFRNVAVHQYQDLKLEVVEAVIQQGLRDLVTFTEHLLEWDQRRSSLDE